MTEGRRRFRYFGPDTPLKPVARAIMEEDIAFLEASLGREWFLNEPFQYCQHCTGLPIQLAAVEGKHRVIEYLLGKRVDLNVQKAPAIVSAVSSLDTNLMDRLLAAGADIHARNKVGYDALDQAVAWEHFELIPYLESKGLSIGGHKGNALDRAVSAGNLEFVEFALKKGADPNRNKSLDQGGTGRTPLHSAVLHNNHPMVSLLLQYGADPKRSNFYGQRPYHWALSSGNTDIADLLRNLEPKSLHDSRTKRKLADGYRTPLELIEFLEQKDRQLKAGDGRPVADLLALEDLYEFRWMRRRYLALSRFVHDDFSCGEIVWCKKRRAVCIIDVEHDEIFEMGAWYEFAADPATAIERIWSGELDAG